MDGWGEGERKQRASKGGRRAGEEKKEGRGAKATSERLLVKTENAEVASEAAISLKTLYVSVKKASGRRSGSVRHV